MKRRRGFTASAMLVAVSSSCSGSPPEVRSGQTTGATSTEAPSPRRTEGFAVPLPAPRWAVAAHTAWVERSEAGLDRMVIGNRRIEARGADVVGSVDAPGDIDGAAAAPPWTKADGAPARYVLWHERDVYGAPEWLGEARKLGTLPAPVEQTFDWLDGTGLYTEAGAFVVRPSGTAPEKLDLPGVVRALAADARRAIVLTAFGHARLTLDAGKSYRDVSEALPEATDLEVRGDELHVLLQGEGRRVVDAGGAVTKVDTPKGPIRHQPPPDLDDRWPEGAASSALETATQYGIVLPDGDAITTDDSTCARVDLHSGRATAIFPLETREERCEPFRAKDGPLLLCESEGHARVLDVASGGRIERTFDVFTGARLDRFVGVDDEALGFIGPCEGAAPPIPADVVSGASPTNASNQRSPVFCVRKGPDAWIEHRLDPADATDVVAWIPRVDGGAVALVAVPGQFLDGAPRVSVRGSLRVVRVARNEPPLDISTYSYESALLLSRMLRATPDGGIEGWSTSGHGPSGLAAISIDPEGHARQHAFPGRTTRVVQAGRLALVSTENNELYETTDWGRTYRLVAPPPSGPTDAEPLSCTEVGCRVGSFIRVGWGAPEQASSPSSPAPSPQYKRPLPAPPLARLGCRFAGPGESKRLPESFGLGVTPNPVPRMAPGRIGFTGALMIPWSGGPTTTISGDADVAYVPLFDLAAPIVRATIPLSRLGPNPFHPFEVRLGYILDGQTVRSVVTSSYGRCAAPLVDEAGLSVATGGCVEEPTIGVVTGGRRAILLHHAYGREIVSALDLPSGPAKPPQLGRAATGSARRELSSRSLPEYAHELLLGAGERRGKPVAVAIDDAGGAVLAPIDRERGRVGEEERLAPLSGLLAPKDPRCAKAPDDARVLVSFDTHIGLVEGSLPGVTATGTAGIAVIRWSPARACLEAIEVAVRDERYEADIGYYDPPGTVRKIVARLEGKDAGKGTLVVLGPGFEVRQPLVCDGVFP